MAATSLGLPPKHLATDKLPVTYINPAKLIRVSSHASGEPYFGKTGGNRFDAPGCSTSSAEFAACYLGYSLPVAIAESILHDEMPVNGKFEIANTTLTGKLVYTFKTGSNLRLLQLTGATLKKLGGTANLSGSINYAITQQWALAIHQNPQNLDGFIYMSRHLNTEKAVILFDRASAKMAVDRSTTLTTTPGFAASARKLGIIGI